TLLPALLGLVGERICTAKARERRRARIEGESHGVADRWVNGVIRLRWLVVGGVVAVLGIAALPAASMDLGIPTGATADRDTAARQSYDAISRGFGEGFSGPLLVTAEPAGSVGTMSQQAVSGILQGLQQHDGIVAVEPVGASEDGDFVVFSVI